MWVRIPLPPVAHCNQPRSNQPVAPTDASRKARYGKLGMKSSLADESEGTYSCQKTRTECMTMSMHRSTMNTNALRSCPFPPPSTICVRETRQCHSRDKGHFRGGTLVLSRFVPSRSSRFSCAMACTSLSSSCVDSSIAFVFFSCSKMRPPSALLGFA
jgi:hypothetical protein